ncbi:MAG TPA: hypothetical protein VKT80_05425 [Chloroflexota bacterium]|nr:hypothetical protein [Chloroflexota bacterium]
MHLCSNTVAGIPVTCRPSTFAGAVTILVLELGPIFSLFYPLVILIGWARLRVSDHSPSRAATGAVLGVVIAATIFPVFR